MIRRSTHLRAQLAAARTPWRSARAVSSDTGAPMVAAGIDRSHHGSDGKFRNPWTDQSKMVRPMLKKSLYCLMAVGRPQSCWQDKSIWEIVSWKRNSTVPGTGWLTGNKKPTASQWAAAFPVAPVDWQALQSPPGNTQATSRKIIDHAARPCQQLLGTPKSCMQAAAKLTHASAHELLLMQLTEYRPHGSAMPAC